ncbi:MFS family (AraJ) (PDB:4LDS) [Commensalibacter communis]|uniref:MFS family (AraJ) n=1 Tax=Commensalibacter communis TaxID=2972786 RepID=A0A9W4TP29_9PROT|nr:MFS transporter [Commensalibacter communis]CAI3938368.1 MFS family (AraJ) (PDB:4LDS) [Commensalibacter communis]CAI3941536.1 MFS family (AraJ) (PDB:4LDS) [Commensalibacter communis]CAI3941975.1 MFS family (AraJ) (PDB:4LDS) [Commensalibacter communis]CAI3948271.1 MFS family (AraJ) (PDB:4LDS) [Commensalibacter communis]CAI3948523.1 MFS family (AraJ) (PDB:4LDS) [Commensalibacter communis]
MPINSLKPSQITLKILAVVIFNLICYINVGMFFTAISVFVHQSLHYNSVIAGMAVSVAYIGTFLTRPSAGRWIDTKGAKSSVIIGLCVSAIGGIFTLISTLFTTFPIVTLLIIILGRLCIGASESWASTGTNLWNISRTGIENATHVISWNGVTSYGGMAIGAPLGIFLLNLPGHFGGLTTIAIVTIVLAGVGAVLASTYSNIAPTPSTIPPLPFTTVFMRVLPTGSGLGLATVGFGSIQAFMALYFVFNGWNGSGYVITLFGICFVFIRFIFKNAIHKYGGYMVSIVSLSIETIGLCFIAFSHSIIGTYIGAGLTGCGFSLIFPALGIIAIATVGAENRGSALACFGLFLDIALFIAGPLLGFILFHWGYYWLFLSAAIFTCAGTILTYILHYQSKYRNLTASNQNHIIKS